MMGERRRSDVFSGADERDLRWYFGPGASAFEGSAFGSTLERANMYDNSEQRAEQQRAWRAEQRDMAMAAEERGEGFAGDGWGPSPTAFITAECRPPPSVQDNEETLMRAARVSRGLSRIAAKMRDGYSVLALAFGAGSEVWAQSGFALGGLYKLTEPGRALITAVIDERAHSQAKGRIQLPHLLHNDLAAAEHVPDTDRIRLHGAAKGAAERLLSAVAEAWNAQKGERDA